MRWLFGLLVIASCVPTSFTYTPATNRGEVAKPENCVVEVVTTPPAKDFEEVGQLDFYNGTEPKTVDDFKSSVAKQVCQVGGDVVIAIANDKGQYTRGTVVRYTKRTDR
jgi:hypothetical protein